LRKSHAPLSQDINSFGRNIFVDGHKSQAGKIGSRRIILDIRSAPQSHLAT
jgi:hypothetical protein